MSGWTPADLLPAVWLLLLAVALDRAARRWAAPIPAAAWAVAGAIVLALFAPSLLLGRVQASLGLLTAFPPLHQLRDVAGPANPLHGDVLFQLIPLQAVVRRFLEAGEWPLWNAWTGAGAPLLANAQAQVLQPLVWLSWLLPLPASLGVVAALRVVVALASTFLLLRYQGAGRYPALFGAAAYALSGFLILYLGWPLANSAALLPLAVYGTVRWMAERDRRSFVLLAMALAAVLVAGHPDTVLWVLISAGLFAVSRLPLGRGRGAGPEPAGPERAPGLRGFARGAAGWVLAVAAAAALTAPVNLPAALQVPHSQRYAMTESREERLEAEIR
ncbi:MAG TPA: YfhO family protein, partial [Thermoanaerobaculia bacterium]